MELDYFFRIADFANLPTFKLHNREYFIDLLNTEHMQRITILLKQMKIHMQYTKI